MYYRHHHHQFDRFVSFYFTTIPHYPHSHHHDHIKNMNCLHLLGFGVCWTNNKLQIQIYPHHHNITYYKAYIHVLYYFLSCWLFVIWCEITIKKENRDAVDESWWWSSSPEKNIFPPHSFSFFAPIIIMIEIIIFILSLYTICNNKQHVYRVVIFLVCRGHNHNGQSRRPTQV